MNDKSAGWQFGFPTQCAVCGNSVPFYQSMLKKVQGYVVCTAMECQQIRNQKSSICPSYFKSLVEKRRSLVQARLASQAAENERVDILQTRMEEESQAIRQLVATRNPDLPQPTSLVNLPSGLSRLTSPAPERMEKYRTHLRSIIREAAKYSSASELTDGIELKKKKKCLATNRILAANPDLHCICNQMCSLCKGGCCTEGREHAYITVTTIRCFMDARPTLSEQEVFDAYMSRIESKMIENSCVNHGKNGCVLAREMRSDACNGFYCDDIKTYHREFFDSNQVVEPIITVQRSHTFWNRWAADSSHEIVAVNIVDAHDVKSVESVEFVESNSLCCDQETDQNVLYD